MGVSKGKTRPEEFFDGKDICIDARDGNIINQYVVLTRICNKQVQVLAEPVKPYRKQPGYARIQIFLVLFPLVLLIIDFLSSLLKYQTGQLLISATVRFSQIIITGFYDVNNMNEKTMIIFFVHII